MNEEDIVIPQVGNQGETAISDSEVIKEETSSIFDLMNDETSSSSYSDIEDSLGVRQSSSHKEVTSPTPKASSSPFTNYKLPSKDILKDASLDQNKKKYS